MKRLTNGFLNVITLLFSPCGLCEGLGLSSTTDWISGRSLTTIRGGRSLWRTRELCWLGVDVWPTCSSSPSLSVSDASPGTLQRPGLEQTPHLNQWQEINSLGLTEERLRIQENLESHRDSLWGRRHGGDVHLIIGVGLWRLALHHKLVSAGHGYVQILVPHKRTCVVNYV